MIGEAMSFSEYASRVSSSAMRLCRDGGLYSGKDGAMRFGRECGYALPDFPDYEKLISSTYSSICVRAYNLSPPIDAKDWVVAIKSGINKRIERNRKAHEGFQPED